MNSDKNTTLRRFLATLGAGTRRQLGRTDQRIEAWLSRHGITVLRYALALVFFWFGIVKPFDVSPADPVVQNGVYFLPFWLFFPILGWWEALVGVGLLYDRTVRPAVYLMVVQMLGTMIPLVTVPEMTFTSAPLVPTEVGAYIIKNWVLLSGGLVVLAAVETRPADGGSTADRSPGRSALSTVRAVERRAFALVDRYGLQLLRYSLAVVLVWFGTLTAAGVGDVAGLVAAAMGVAPTDGAAVALGLLKVAGGIALLHRRTTRLAFLLVAMYVAVTSVPLVTMPAETFTRFPYGPSFEGVYVVKNWVLLGAGMVVGGAVK